MVEGGGAAPSYCFCKDGHDGGIYNWGKKWLFLFLFLFSPPPLLFILQMLVD